LWLLTIWLPSILYIIYLIGFRLPEPIISICHSRLVLYDGLSTFNGLKPLTIVPYQFLFLIMLVYFHPLWEINLFLVKSLSIIDGILICLFPCAVKLIKIKPFDLFQKLGCIWYFFRLLWSQIEYGWKLRNWIVDLNTCGI